MPKARELKEVRHFSLTPESPLNEVFVCEDLIELPHQLACQLFDRKARDCGTHQLTLENVACLNKKGDCVIWVLVEDDGGAPVRLVGNRDSGGNITLHVTRRQPEELEYLHRTEPQHPNQGWYESP